MIDLLGGFSANDNVSVIGMSAGFGNNAWHGKPAAFTLVQIDSERSGSFRTYFSGLRQFGVRARGQTPRENRTKPSPSSTRKIACNHPFLRLPGRRSFNPRNPTLGFAHWPQHTSPSAHTHTGRSGQLALDIEPGVNIGQQ